MLSCLIRYEYFFLKMGLKDEKISGLNIILSPRRKLPKHKGTKRMIKFDCAFFFKLKASMI